MHARTHMHACMHAHTQTRTHTQRLTVLDRCQTEQLKNTNSYQLVLIHPCDLFSAGTKAFKTIDIFQSSFLFVRLYSIILFCISVILPVFLFEVTQPTLKASSRPREQQPLVSCWQRSLDWKNKHMACSNQKLITPKRSAKAQVTWNQKEENIASIKKVFTLNPLWHWK